MKNYNYVNELVNESNVRSLAKRIIRESEGDVERVTEFQTRMADRLGGAADRIRSMPFATDATKAKMECEALIFEVESILRDLKRGCAEAVRLGMAGELK